MLSSPNFGALFAFTSSELVSSVVSSGPESPGLKAARYPDTKMGVLNKTLKKPRFLKRALFALPFADAIAFSLFSFSLALFFLPAVVSRKPAFVHLRSPPQL